APSPPFHSLLSCSPSQRGLHSFPTRRSSDLAGRRTGSRACGAFQAESGVLGKLARRAPATHENRPDPSEFWMMVVKKGAVARPRSEEHTSELQSRENLVCRRLLEKKK